MKNLFTTLALGLASASMVACSGQSFSKVGDTSTNIDQSVSQQQQCEIDPVDYVISASIYDFEVTDTTNASFGFNLNGILKALGLNFNMSSGKMALTMTVDSPLNSQVTLASVAGSSTFTSGGGGVNLNIGTIGLGASYMASTPFATLTSNGLTNGLANATKKLASVQGTWSTKVVQVENTSTFIVGAGTKAGLQVGDQLAIYNIDNRWSGVPCTSQLLISQKTTSTPIAIVQVTQTNPFNSLVQVVSRNWSDAIAEGAVAESYVLTGKNRVLNRSVRIGSVTSPVIPVSNGQSIDIQGYAQQQFPTIVDGTSGYFLHQ